MQKIFTSVTWCVPSVGIDNQLHIQHLKAAAAAAAEMMMMMIHRNATRLLNDLQRNRLTNASLSS